MPWISSPQGETLRFTRGEVFFGNALSGKLQAPHRWQKSWRLQQVHGDAVIPANPQLHAADGHFTQHPGQPLAIQTADCMPVMVSLNHFETVWALHIGWKGLQKRIFTKALQSHRQKKLCLSVWVGPHIHKQSFFLSKQNTLALLKGHSCSLRKALDQGWIEKYGEKKEQYSVDLAAILKAELANHPVQDLWISPINTFSNPNYYSHRRHTQTRGRQLSSIQKF